MADLSKWFKKNILTRYVTTECPERKKCLETLEMILDGELNDDEQADYRDHISQCWSCFQDYKLEKAIRDLIKIKMERKEVPQQLLTIIKDRISESFK